MRKYLFVATTAAIVAFLVFQPQPTKPQEPLLRVEYLDVGQGDSILITTPSEYQVLLDGGPNQAVLGQLQQVMPVGDTSLDLVILSHPDADHLAGLVDVARDYQIGLILMPDVSKDTKLYKEWLKVLAQKNIEHRAIMARENLTLPDGAQLAILHPSPLTYNTGEPANDASIVLRLDYQQRSFLFTGDIEAKIEERLTHTFPNEIDVDILKVPHHGSKTSSTAPFLQVVTPQLAIIQVAANNRYHHPAPSVLTRYETLRIATLRNDQLGAIRLETDGQTVWQKGLCPALTTWIFSCKTQKVYTFSDNP